MDKKPLLSVIVPIYNVERYLEDALDSLCDQTYANLEIILVNDLSTDNSLQICKQFAKKDPRVKLVERPENGGLSAARNSGLEVMTGEYVTFFDSDDILHPEAYTLAMQSMIAEDAGMVRFGYTRFHGVPDILPIKEPIDKKVYDTPEDIKCIMLSLIGRPVGAEMPDYDLGGSAWSAMFQADIIKRNSLTFPKSRHITSEDYIFNFEYMQYISKFVKLNFPLYFYRINPNSLTMAPRKGRALEILDTGKYMEDLIQRYGYSTRDAARGMRFAIDVLRTYVKNTILSDMPLSEKKKWISELCADPKVQRLYEEYPWRSMPWKHRIMFAYTANGNYPMLSLMVKGLAKIRGGKTHG